MASPMYSQIKKYISMRYSLTNRESEILSYLLTFGCTNKDIAIHFDISEKTVKIHLSNIMEKLNTSSIRKLLSQMILPMLTMDEKVSDTKIKKLP